MMYVREHGTKGTTVPMSNAQRLGVMVAELKQVRVEELHHQDWQSTLFLLGHLITDINALGRSGAPILRVALERAQRSRLPVPRRDADITDKENPMTSPRLNRYSARELEAMPTLATGQADDLKVQTEEYQVWLSRTGKADGEPYDNKITVERLVDGKWITVRTYQG